ncbi:MAG: hypothetical protein H6585_07470 [Flavobacteriales bacterium]|nr:hypothetical protein [Flavobacteriales bacterium]
MNWIRKYGVECAFGLVLGLWFGLRLTGFNGLYGQDSHTYFHYALAIRDYLKGGSHPGAFFWPVMYPLIGALASWFTVHTAAVMQMVSMMAFAVVITLVVQLIPKIHKTTGPPVQLYVILTLLFAPYFMRASLFVMSDMTATAFFMLALDRRIRFYTSGRSLDIWLAGVFAMAAVCTRLPVAVLLAPLLLMQVGTGATEWKVKHVAGVILAAVLVALPQWWFNRSGPVVQSHELLQEWSPFNLFKNTFDATGRMQYTVPNGMYMLSVFGHAGYLMISVPLLPFLRKKDFSKRPANWLWFSVILYVVFLGGIPFQNQRFFVLAFPVVVLLFYPAFTRAWNWFSQMAGLRVFGCVVLLLLQFALFAYSFSSFVRYCREEKQAATEVIRLVPPGHTLYVFGMQPALTTYGVKNPMTDIWQDDIGIVQPGDFLLLNGDVFSSQWAGQNPMRHWQEIKDQFELDHVNASLAEGWILYEIR